MMKSQESIHTPSGSWQGRFTAGRLMLFVSLLLFALYPGVILCSQTFFFRDYTLFTYPAAWYEHECFWRGEMPLWNPLNNCGIPFLAQWNTSACYPPSVIYMLLPLPWSLNFFLLGHLIFAGVGMYLLVHRWTESRFAASVSGVVFALNGLMINCLMWTSNLAAIAWEPVVILCVERAWRSRERRHIAMAALAGAMQMLSGAPEIILFTWAFIGCLWLVQVVRRQVFVRPAICILLFTIVLVGSLSALQLFPFFDLLRHSQRDSTYTVADSSPMPLWGFANFFVPLFRAAAGSFDVYVQPKQNWTSSYYVGAATLLLAAMAVWRLLRNTAVWVAATVTIIALALCLGNDGYVYAWTKQLLPWIGFARYPIKFISVPVFAIPLLAGFGLTWFEAQRVASGRKNIQSITILLMVGLAVIVGIIISAVSNVDGNIVLEPAFWSGAISAAVLLVVAGILIALARTQDLKHSVLLGFALMTVIGSDLIFEGKYLNPTVDANVFRPIELNMDGRPKLGDSRAIVDSPVFSYLMFGGTTNAFYYVVGIRGALFENCNIPENIPKVDGFCSLHLQHEWKTTIALYSSTNEMPEPFLDFLGVSEISDGLFSWQHRTNSLPLATIGQRPLFDNDTNVLANLTSNHFDPRHTVYLPIDAKAVITAVRDDSAQILSKNVSAQNEQFSVQTASRTMMVFAQSYYHNWHAYVDGRETPLFRANSSYQAMEVPAGKHEVTLRYEDWMFQIGTIISGLALVVCGVMWFAPKRTSSPGGLTAT